MTVMFMQITAAETRAKTVQQISRLAFLRKHIARVLSRSILYLSPSSHPFSLFTAHADNLGMFQANRSLASSKVIVPCLNTDADAFMLLHHLFYYMYRKHFSSNSYRCFLSIFVTSYRNISLIYLFFFSRVSAKRNVFIN